MTEPTFGTQELLTIIRRRWWMIVGSTIVLGAAAWAVSAFALPSRYESSSELLLNQSDPSALIVESPTANQPVERIVENEIAFAQSPAVEAQASEILGFDATIAATSSELTDAIELLATEDNPEKAQLVAETFTNVYLEMRRVEVADRFSSAADAIGRQIDDLEATLVTTRLASDRDRLGARIEDYQQRLNDLQISADAARANIVVLGEPDLAESPSAPKPIRNGLVGAALGLALGVAVAIGRMSMDDRFSSPSEVESRLGLPVLGEIPRLMTGRRTESSLIDISNPSSPFVGGLRSALVAIRAACDERHASTVLVMGMHRAAGASTIASNLAILNARGGQPTLLIDVCLDNPSVGTQFGVSPGSGLAELISGVASIDQASHPVPNEPMLRVIPAGNGAGQPQDLILGPSSRSFFDQTSDLEDGILVLLDGTDLDHGGLAYVELADLVVLVADSTTDGAEDLQEAARRLDRSGATVIGLVLNRWGREKPAANAVGGVAAKHSAAALANSSTETRRTAPLKSRS